MGNQGSLVRPGSPVASIKSQSPAAGTVNGASLDTRGYEEVLVVISVGAIVAAHTLDIHLEESDDDSTWADITGGAFTQFTDGAGHENVCVLGRVTCSHSARERYIRAVGVSVGATPIPYTVLLIPTRDQTGNGIAFDVNL